MQSRACGFFLPKNLLFDKFFGRKYEFLIYKKAKNNIL